MLSRMRSARCKSVPAGWLGFACRVCHGLKYRSSQLAHAEERFCEKPVVKRVFAMASEWLAKLERQQQSRGLTAIP
jgi:hypothetical protein